ncbi:MAG: cystathionine beta-lyase [Novosphingobium sp.]
MAKTDNPQSTATKLVTTGRGPAWPVVNPPVWRASTHLFANTAELAERHRSNQDGQFYYGRRGAPTQWALAEALTELEPGAFGTMLYPSGVAAIAATLLTVLRPGDVVLMTDSAYDPSRALGKGMLSEFGIETRFFPATDLAAFEAAICGRTRAVLLEAPGSLTMEMQDVPAIAAICRSRGIVSIIDNTWAGPLGFQPLRHGVDISVMSLTKHVGGHSDVMMGSAAAGEEWYGKLRRRAQNLGQTVSPDDAALMLRGLRTLALRLERETASALAVAQWLHGREEVAAVLYPCLPGSPGHELWAHDFTGGCGLFSAVLKGGDAAARNRLIDALELFGIGYSFGGFESLVIPVDPAPIRAVTPWPLAGLDPADKYALRLAIGLEDPADLIADLERGLAAMRG